MDAEAGRTSHDLQVEAADAAWKAGRSRDMYRRVLLLVFLITMGVLVYCAQAQRVPRETAKPDSAPTSPTKESTGDDVEKRLTKTEEKIDKLESANTRLEHNIDQAGAYSANASNTATYVITAVGIFVIVVTLIAGFGTQFVGERQLKAALSDHQAQLKVMEEALSQKITDAIEPLKETQENVKGSHEQLEAGLKSFEERAERTHKHFETQFAGHETKLNEELKDLRALKEAVEKLRDYQQKNFEPADKIKEEFRSLFEPSNKIKKDIISILLYDRSLPFEFRTILLDEDRRLNELPPIQHGAASVQPTPTKNDTNETKADESKNGD